MPQNIVNSQTFSANELIAASTLGTAKASSVGQELTTRSTGFKIAEWIVGVFTLGIGALPFEIYKAFKDDQAFKLADNVIDLKNTLLTFKEGEPAEKKVKLHGEKITLQQDCHNKLTATFKDGRTIDMPLGALQLAAKLDKDIVSHPDFYGSKAALEVLTPHAASTNPNAYARSLFLSALEATVGENLGNVTTIRTEYLGHLACKAMAGQIKDAYSLDSFVTGFQRPSAINAEDCLDLLQSLEEAEKTDSAGVAKSVILPKLDFTSKALEAQDPKITQIRNLAADIIYDKDTWIHDVTAKPGERLYQSLTKHTSTLFLLYNEPDLLDKTGLPEPIKDALSDITTSLPFKAVAFIGKEAGISSMLKAALNTKQFEEAEKKIDKSLLELVPEAQKQISESLNAMFPSAAEKNAKNDELKLQDNEPQLQDNEPVGTGVLAELERARKKLDAMLEASVSDVDSPGYGKFMKESMIKYFGEQAPIDKRAMLAASIRYAHATATEGVVLGALLKGAGPIMQKMLQGFNTANMDPAFAEVLSDMKTNLAPIHEKIVKAQLYGMVQDSKGSITNIEVVKSLGAASVGQAFLCKVTTPQQEEPVDCVIKLLRPDVKARADRERHIFEGVAKEIPGMEVTFAGQMQRIMDELDLTKEAKNIELSSVYDEPFTNVHTMQILPSIDATTSAMALKKAPGVTLDAFYRNAKMRIEEVLSDSEGATSTAGLEKINTLLEMYEELGTLQGALQNGASTWVAEGIFGGGFYHGDLHAGNMMFDKDYGLTMIDYGNATALTSDHQSNVTLMMAAATAGDTQKFLKGYRSLLSPKGVTTFDEKQTKLTADLNTIMSLGKMQDAGKRIAVCLATAAKMGIESPGPIFNFSQCQIRLQGTLDSMNELGDTLIQSMSTVLANANWTGDNKHRLKELIQNPLSNVSIPEWINGNHIDILADGYIEIHEKNPAEALPEEKELIGIRDITKKIAESIRPQVTFCDCMADVLQENLGATVKRVGFGGVAAMQRAQAAQDIIEAQEAQEKNQIAQEKKDREWEEEIAKGERIAERARQAEEARFNAQQNPQPQQV